MCALTTWRVDPAGLRGEADDEGNLVIDGVGACIAVNR
jgi:hypothetical protein